MAFGLHSCMKLQIAEFSKPNIVNICIATSKIHSYMTQLNVFLCVLGFVLVVDVTRTLLENPYFRQLFHSALEIF